MHIDYADRPNQFPWPPVLLAGAFFCSLIIEGVLPTRTGISGLLGLLLFILGLAVDIWAMLTLRRARTNILPNRAADRLVTRGPYRWSRNPIYVGNTTLLLGLAIIFDSAWMIMAAFAMAFAVHHLAVLREEQHLAERFGADWTAYKDRTPRWLGRQRR